MSDIKQKLVMALIVVVVVAGVAAAWWYWRPANNANFPDGTFWVCSNQQCKAELVLTMKQLGQHEEKHYGQPITCSKCGKEMVRANRCPKCSKFYPQVRNVEPVCPYCKAKLAG